MRKTKYFLPVLFCLMLVSCATTPVRITSNDPCIFEFEFNGSKSEVRPILKRILVEAGYTIANDDIEAGIIVTQEKILNLDEAPKLAIAATGTQIGMVTFIYEMSNPTKVFFKNDL